MGTLGHMIPADRKWFARVAASGVIIEALADIVRFPEVSEEDPAALLEERAMLVAER